MFHIETPFANTVKLRWLVIYTLHVTWLRYECYSLNSIEVWKLLQVWYMNICYTDND